MLKPINLIRNDACRAFINSMQEMQMQFWAAGLLQFETEYETRHTEHRLFMRLMLGLIKTTLKKLGA